MTKHELCQLVMTPEELKSYDIALPHNFCVDCDNLLNIDPRPFMIWCYKDNIFGYPINLAERFYMMYNKAPDLWDAAQALLIDAQDRGETTDDDGEIYDDFLHLGHALDAITLDKRAIMDPPKILQS